MNLIRIWQKVLVAVVEVVRKSRKAWVVLLMHESSNQLNLPNDNAE